MSKPKNDGKFIMTEDPTTAIVLKHNGMKLIGQDGTVWYFVRDDEKLEINKKTFAKKKCKFVFTNRLLFNNEYGVEYPR